MGERHTVGENPMLGPKHLSQLLTYLDPEKRRLAHYQLTFWQTSLLAGFAISQKAHETAFDLGTISTCVPDNNLLVSCSCPSD